MSLRASFSLVRSGTHLACSNTCTHVTITILVSMTTVPCPIPPLCYSLYTQPNCSKIFQVTLFPSFLVLPSDLCTGTTFFNYYHTFLPPSIHLEPSSSSYKTSSQPPDPSSSAGGGRGVGCYCPFVQKKVFLVSSSWLWNTLTIGCLI